MTLRDSVTLHYKNRLLFLTFFPTFSCPLPQFLVTLRAHARCRKRLLNFRNARSAKKHRSSYTFLSNVKKKFCRPLCSLHALLNESSVLRCLGPTIITFNVFRAQVTRYIVPPSIVTQGAVGFSVFSSSKAPNVSRESCYSGLQCAGAGAEPE